MLTEEFFDLIYVALNHTLHFNYKHLEELISSGYISNHRDLSKLIYENKTAELQNQINIPQILSLSQPNEIKRVINLAEKYAKDIEANRIFTVSSEDEYYPVVWKELRGMPRVIFGKGHKELLLQLNSNGAVAVVGSRYPSRYAIEVTHDFTKQLSDKNLVIVSGMAMGIDREAHLTALNSKKGTIGILPGGCDVVYPYQNRDIYTRMYEHDLVLSELPPETEVMKQYFPSRNRLISAISDACLIMEAGVSSGTLHTASFAANQGKPVFVLPNSIYCENALGGLQLINDGARLLLNTGEVLGEVAEEVCRRLTQYPELLNSVINSKNTDCSPDLSHYIRARMSLSQIELIRTKMNKRPDDMTYNDWKALIMDSLSGHSKCTDDLLREFPLGISLLSSLLTEMELEGEIYTRGEKYCLA